MTVLECVLIAIEVKPVLALPSVVYPVEYRLRYESTPVGGCAIGIEIGLIDHLHILLSVKRAGTTVRVRLSHETIVSDGYFPFLALFGGYEDHTVCRTRAIDRCGCGIFKDIDGLDVIGIDSVESVVGCAGDYTVYDKQRR